MPELPEVETIKSELDKALKGKVFRGVEVLWSKTVEPQTEREFGQKIKNKKILKIARRAKVIIFHLSDQTYLAVHLKMTGQLIYKPKKGRLVVGGHSNPPAGRGGTDNLPNKYTRLVFNFTDGSQLFFNDLRKFGWICWLDQAALDVLTSGHGLEPLEKEFTLAALQQILARYPKRKVKQILLDQKLIAGVGNIYADEACFAAHILPIRVTKTLTSREIKDLYHHLIRILKLSISKKGTSSNNYRRSDGSRGNFMSYLKVYGRAKLKCLRCKTLIEKIKFNGRGTQYCPNCQR